MSFKTRISSIIIKESAERHYSNYETIVYNFRILALGFLD